MRQLPDWIDAFMHLTRNTEPAVLFRKWSAVSTVASALQRKCFLNWGSLTFYPNLYVVLIAPPGCRKGTAMTISMDFLEEIRIKMAAEAITREALIGELKSSTDTITDPIAGTMEFHSSLTIHSQELTVFLGYQNHQLMSDLSDWFDCRKRWTYRTKHMGTDEIIGVWVNLYGATTPTLLQTAMPLDVVGSGMASRIIFVYETKKGQVNPCPFWTKEDISLREAMIVDLHRIKNLMGRFTVTDKFLEKWVEWYPEQDLNHPFDDPRFGGYFERRATHIMKLGMILNASRTDSMVVDIVDLNAAISLLEATEVNMPHTFEGLGKSTHAELIPRVMTIVGNAKTITFGDLLFQLRFDTDQWTLGNCLRSLEAMRVVKRNVEENVIEYLERS